MISHRIVHIGIGRTGEAMIRSFFNQFMSSRIHWLETGAHLPLSYARTFSSAPSFSFVRNPFDWYVAYWIRDMEIHAWRGAFRDWFYKRRAVPSASSSMLEYFQYLGGFEIDYVGRFECFLDDLVFMLGQIIPDLVSESEIRQAFGDFLNWSYGCLWIEDVEQWMREELYTQDMVEQIYAQDEPLFRQFGYSYEEKYYFSGGGGESAHPGLTVGDWESEKVLFDHWANWEGRGIYVR